VEQQAKKISKTLGKSPVEQTGTALQTSAATVKTVSDSALSQTDGVLALVIANKSGKPVADVLKLRATGLGWGRIMQQLNVSGRDIGKAMSQVNAVTATSGQGENSKPAVSNKNGDKVVVSGQITGVSSTIITVDGKSFVIGSTTELKYRGKAITAADIATKLAAGKLYATVQGTKQVDTSILADRIIVQDGAESEQTNPSSEHAAVSNEQQKRGKVTVVTATILHIDGFASDIVLNADTKVEQVGAGNTNLAAIKVGQTVQVHVILSGTTYTAQQVHIEDKYIKSNTTVTQDETTNSAVTTWQGTIAAIFPLNNSITVTTDANSLHVFRITATSVLQNTSHKSFLFANLTVGQKVTITGKTLTDQSIEVVKLIVTTTTSTNPGKGNGKH
jgi:hypothetical protein